MIVGGCSKDDSSPELTARCADVARRLFKLRDARVAMIGAGLFGDPAWDILLDLFIARQDGQDLSVSAVCIGATASSATVLRYISRLMKNGLVDRIPDPTDKRRWWVRLTDNGQAKMVALLLSLVL